MKRPPTARMLRRRFAIARRRGSTILVVLALLSVLGLLAITLTYTSRLEEASSRNFSQSLQKNENALSAIGETAKAAMETMPVGAVGRFTLDYGIQETTAQRRRVGSTVVASADNSFGPASRSESVVRANTSPGIRTGTSQVRIRDLSGRINVNTADAETLARIIEPYISLAGRGAGANALAANIVAWRYGPDGAPGTAGVDDNESAGESLAKRTDSCAVETYAERSFSSNSLRVATSNAKRLEQGCLHSAAERKAAIEKLDNGIDEADEYVADPRYRAFGDDRRFGTLGDLIEIDGFTPELISALKPYLTVFSQAQEVRLDPDNAGAEPMELIDLNRACVEDIYDALVMEFGGEKDDQLLRQYACNIVDWRDRDRIPTTLPSSTGGGFVVGLERVPVISEVYPDAAAPENRGDQGEFVEIHNPWEESFNVDGWRLIVQPGAQIVILTGVIPSGGQLIVTDDYDDEADSNGWSLVDQFGGGATVEGISSRLLVEVPDFSLPGTAGSSRVQLQDRDGNLVDEFVYTINGRESSVNSYQRANVLVRESIPAAPTPFFVPNSGAPTATIATRLENYPPDVPFTGVLELFEVFAAWAGPEGETGSRWDFPVIGSTDGSNDPALLDARIVDLFTVEAVARPSLASRKKDHSGKSLLDPWSDRAASGLLTGKNSADAEALLWSRYAPRPVGLREGLINVNTASEAVLRAIGMSSYQINWIADRRSAAEDDAFAGIGDGVAYRRLSDILADEGLWGDEAGEICETLSSAALLFDQLTVTSNAFLLEGTPLQAADSDLIGNSGPLVEAYYAFDTASPNLVYWRFAQ